MTSNVNIPRLDLLDFTEGTPAQRKQFSNDIGTAFTETGFVTIANHGMDKSLIDELYATVQQFFALPEEKKSLYEIPGLAGQRGYTSKGKEKAKDAHTPDLKEFWQRGQTVIGDEALKQSYPENVKVQDLPRFNAVTEEVYRRLEIAGGSLLKAISLYLDLDEDYFEDKIKNGNSILRAIHYFPIENPETISPDAVRAGAHDTELKFFLSAGLLSSP